jgi:putative ABC transport system permease protein
LPETFSPTNEYYLHYKENSKLIDGVFTFGWGTSTLRTDDRVERIPMAWPTNDMYTTLGVRPQLGRLPVPEDNDDVVLISDRLWNTWFGRDPSVIGKSYFVSDSIKQIIGVMPENFRFPEDETMLWVAGEIRLQQVRPGQGGGQMVARMKEGVTRFTGLRAHHPAAPRRRGARSRSHARADDQRIALDLAEWRRDRAPHRLRQRCQLVPGAG